jgi:hypothetical protein
MGSRRLIFAAVLFLLSAIAAYGGYCGYLLVRPDSMTVENRTDGEVTVMVGTVYRLDVEPRSTGELDTGWFGFEHDVFEVFSGGKWNLCRWQDHLVVDDEGAQCARPLPSN